jgi:hypothetical protein
MNDIARWEWSDFRPKLPGAYDDKLMEAATPNKSRHKTFFYEERQIIK